MRITYYLRFGHRFNDYEPFYHYEVAEDALISSLSIGGEPECIIYECRDNILKPIREGLRVRAQNGEIVVTIRDFGAGARSARVVPIERPKPYESSTR